MPLVTDLSPDCRTLTLRVRGRLDLGLAARFWSASARTGGVPERYVVDLSGAEEVFDSGLALLLMLYRRARRLGSRVHLVNASPALMARWGRVLRFGFQVEKERSHP